MSARAAQEILAGIYDGLTDPVTGIQREPSPELQRKINALEEQAAGRDWSRSCRCGAWEGGWDCMCNE